MKKIFFVIVLVIFMAGIASPAGAIVDPYKYKLTAPAPIYVTTVSGKLPIGEFYVNTPIRIGPTAAGFTQISVAGITSWVYVKTSELFYVLK